MRRACTLLAAAALFACSSKDDPPAPQPPAPPVLQAVAGADSVTLTWTDPNDPPATRFDLYWSDAGTVTLASPAVTGVTSPHVHGPALPPGRTYRYAIVAVGAAGTSALSAEVTATIAWTGQLATELPRTGITTFGQNVPGGPEHFPGQSGYWDLDADFSILSGGLFGGPFAGAQLLHVGRLATWPPTLDSLVTERAGLDFFPPDQGYAELVFRTPAFGAADGVAAAVLSTGATVTDLAVPISGSRSAFLNATSGSRLQQSLDLTAATEATVGWKQIADVGEGLVPGAGASFAAVLRAADGVAAPQTLAPACTEDGATRIATCSAAVPAAALGRQAVLSFEFRGALPGIVVLDDVTVTGTGAPSVANPGFETDDAWTANALAEPQNVTSGARTLCVEGPFASPCTALRVTRSFFAAPAGAWARIVDVFENPGAADVAADVVYLTGCAAAAPVTYDPGGWGNAVAAYDASAFPEPVRSFALVLGDAVPYHGSGAVFAVRSIVVPPGGRVALASFLVMDGTYGAAASTGVDALAAAIADGFASDATYRDWLTQAQLDAIANF